MPKLTITGLHSFAPAFVIEVSGIPRIMEMATVHAVVREFEGKPVHIR
jgi:hypothetical protein